MIGIANLQEGRIMKTNKTYNLFDPPSPNELIVTATEYCSKNLSVIPAKADKTPLINWAIYQKERMTNGAISKNFMNAHSLGIVCGKISENLEVIDIDCKYDNSGRLENDFVDLFKDNLPNVFDKLLIISTKNRGLHLYYRCLMVEGSKKLAVNGQGQVLIETRGEGGYIIAPPSPGYSIKSGSINKIPLISKEEREILFTICSTFDEKPLVQSQEYTDQEHKYNGLSPFEDFNERADVLNLLVKAGWQISKEYGERVHLIRPGKDKGISGNWHKIKRVFYVFSTSSQFEARKGYNAVGVYCLIECNNDFSEASRRLYEEGYGERRKNDQHKEQTKTINESTPVLPIEGFPIQIQNLINHCVEIYGTPLDFWAGAVIAATALAIGNKFELKTKYENVPIFWTCIVGNVSSGKTEPQKLLLKPFIKLDDASHEKYLSENAEYDRISGMSKKEREEEGVTIPPKPKKFQYRTKDATPEAMAEIHQINQRGFVIDREEIKGWLDDFGRYNKSGEQSNMLSTWSGVSVMYNRKGSEPINIPNPVINVLGGIQPDLLPSLASDNRAENGFVSRMCFVYPDNTKKPIYNARTLPENIYSEWEKFITDLISIPDVTKLSLTPDAHKIYESWFNENTVKINDEPNQHLKGVYGKLDIISLRLAIVIKGMKYILDADYDENISAEIMQSAIDITEYFRATALKVYAKMFSTDRNSIEKGDVIHWVCNNLKKSKTEIAKFFETSRSQVDRIEKKVNSKR